MRNVIAILVAMLAMYAFALSGYVKVFSKTYHLKKDSKLSKAKCLVCHTEKTGKKFGLTTIVREGHFGGVFVYGE